MTQGEFTNILETIIKPFISSLIIDAAFPQDNKGCMG